MDPRDNHSTAGEVDPRAHGYGPIEVDLPNFPTVIDQRVVDASKMSSSEFPFNIDINAGDSVGFGIFCVHTLLIIVDLTRFVGLIQSMAGGGERSSAVSAYLDPAVQRENLDVLIQHTATRLLSNHSMNGTPLFDQVELAANQSGMSSLDHGARCF